MTMSTEQVLELLQETAERVIRPRWRALSDHQIDEKEPGDYVTVADRESEEILTAALKQAYPNTLVVGEEATAADPGLLQALGRAEHAFVVDPVDGTRNFVNGSSDYAVMIGEIRGGEAVRGWIWQPELDAAWIAERGAGVTRNGERIRRAAADQTRLHGETSHRRLLGEIPEQVTELGWTNYSCGIDYPLLCAGGIDFIIYRNLKPWDHVPGALMVREAGGVARTTRGVDYECQIDGGPLVAAADEDTWRAGIACLADPMVS